MQYEKVTVIVPSFNPDEKLGEVISGLRAAGFTDVIVVDDGSREDTKQFFAPARECENCTLLTHEVNRGKGAALKTALRFFSENRPDGIGAVTADGDGQHSTEDIVACARALCETPDTFIIGARDFDLPQVPGRSRFGNKMTSLVFRGIGMKITDTQSGLRAIPASAVPALLEVKGDRYEYETNVLIALKHNAVPLREIRISTVYIEQNSSSHFRVIRDSVRIYANILRYTASSLICAGVDALVFFILTQIFRPEPEGWLISALVVAARVVSSALNYTLNRRIVFKSSNRTSVVRYFILAVCVVAVSSLSVKFLAMLLGARAPVLQTAIKIAIDLVLFFISYRIQKIWVFKKVNINGESE